MLGGMDDHDLGRMTALMQRMAAHETAAIFEFEGDFGAELRRVVASDLRRYGAQPSRASLDALVVDACVVIYDVAGGWRGDGGAPPWVWARARIRAMVASWVGIHTAQLDDERVTFPEPPIAPVDDNDDIEVLRQLAAKDLRVAVLQDALDAVATHRGSRILIELSVQRSLGDPSPAHTVARRVGMKPDAVRQSAKRTRDRLRALASANEAFADLQDLALLA